MTLGTSEGCRWASWAQSALVVATLLPPPSCHSMGCNTEKLQTQAWLVLTARGHCFGLAPSVHSDHKGGSLLSAALGCPFLTPLCVIWD